MKTDINMAFCLSETSNLTEKIVTNVCSGEVTTIPYGTLDIFGHVAVVIMLILSTVVLSFIARFMIKEMRNEP